MNEETIEQIKAKLETSTRKKPVHVKCGTAGCDCSYHYLKDGKLFCVRVKRRESYKKEENDEILEKTPRPLQVQKLSFNSQEVMPGPFLSQKDIDQANNEALAREGSQQRFKNVPRAMEQEGRINSQEVMKGPLLSDRDLEKIKREKMRRGK